MQFLTIIVALATTIAASPILRRDQYPSIPTVDQTLNRVVLVPGSASDLSRRDMAAAVVDPTSLTHVLEHEDTGPLRARDQFPAVPVVDQELNRVKLVPGSASDVAAAAATRRDLVVPVVDLEQNRVVEHAGAATNERRDVAGGIVPVVMDAGHIVAVPMTPENTA